MDDFINGMYCTSKFLSIFQDLVALLAGLLVIGWWLADWVRSGFVVVSFISFISSTANMLHILVSEKVSNALVQDLVRRIPRRHGPASPSLLLHHSLEDLPSFPSISV